MFYSLIIFILIFILYSDFPSKFR